MNKKILYRFLLVTFVAVALGIVAGKYVAAKGLYITLTPPRYMDGLVYNAPWLMVAAVVALVMCICKKAGIKQRLLLSVYVYTVIGIIASGFCGMYTMGNFILVALGLVMGFVVLLALTVMGNTSHRIHSEDGIDYNNALLSKAGFVVYGTVVMTSAFFPIGPLPVMVLGALCAVAVAVK